MSTYLVLAILYLCVMLVLVKWSLGEVNIKDILFCIGCSSFFPIIFLYFAVVEICNKLDTYRIPE